MWVKCEDVGLSVDNKGTMRMGLTFAFEPAGAHGELAAALDQREKRYQNPALEEYHLDQQLKLLVNALADEALVRKMIDLARAKIAHTAAATGDPLGTGGKPDPEDRMTET
jgi:hypothetical protein